MSEIHDRERPAAGVLLSVVLAACCGLVSSCGKPDDRVAVYPVSGRITVNGEPAYGALLTFHPVGDVGLKESRAFARADRDGTFQATTYETGDGAPAGEYRVTVYWPKNPEASGPSPDRLRGRFARPENTPLRAAVTEGENVLPPFELELRPGGT